jgi:hypothetical protein
VSSNKDSIKTLIELSNTWEEADKMIEEFANIQDISQKLGYIKGMFDVSVIGKTSIEKNQARNDYVAMLSAIVNKKWR